MATTATPWTGTGDDKLYLQSGQFNSTLKTSLSVGAVDTVPEGISWDGTNTPWVGSTDDKLYLTSGNFTSTIKTSLSVGAVDTTPRDIETNDVNSRLGIFGHPAVKRFGGVKYARSGISGFSARF